MKAVLICFQCGDEISARQTEASEYFDGQMRFFCRGMFRDHKNDWTKEQREKQKQAQQDRQRVLQAARSTH